MATTVAAQAEDEAGRLIERPWTLVLETFLEGGTQFAGEAPFSGDTIDFDGLCSEPVDLMWRFVWEGLASIFGHLTGMTIACVKAEWDVDAETGHLTSAFSVATSGGGTGRFAGAALFGTSHCRRVDPEAVEAGVEPQLCVMDGMIRYDPFAGTGE